ncbi:MAG: hypothetical protein ABIQ26_23215 [Streptosporangiaceae bacterium]
MSLSMDWDGFSERLAAELAALDPQMVLVVHRRTQGSHYVQAFRTGSALRAEAVSSAVLSTELKFDPQVEDRLADLGWQTPAPHANWSYDLDAEATPGQFRRLARMMAIALREVQGTAEPAELAYEAFRGSTFLALTELGIDPADPVRATEKRATPTLAADEDAPPAGVAARASSHVSSPHISSPRLQIITPDPLPPPPPPPPPPAAPAAPKKAREPDPKARLVQVRLVEAKANRDREGYLRALLDARLFVPEPRTMAFSDGVYLLAYTSRQALATAGRGGGRQTTLTQLADDWPQPHWQLAIDDGLPSAGYLDCATIGSLSQAKRHTNPLVLQKVLPHPLVVHYLEGGYDRVAGYVHRVADVLDLTTPALLVHHLGLSFDGTPFFAEDEDVHVLRWTSLISELMHTPYGGLDLATAEAMPGGWVVEHPPFDGSGFAPGAGSPIPEFKIDSQRVPHGAEIHRLQRSGRHTLVALFDADTEKWTAL